MRRRVASKTNPAAQIPNAPKGYRGYISARATAGGRTPQHVQNLVIRDYASRRQLQFKLSVTEYVMPGAFMQLHLILEDLQNLEGVILYSLFMLPANHLHRMDIYRKVLDRGCSLHFAVEGLTLETPEDIERLETLWCINDVMESQDISSLRALIKSKDC